MGLHSSEIHGTGWISWSFQWRKYFSRDHTVSRWWNEITCTNNCHFFYWSGCVKKVSFKCYRWLSIFLSLFSLPFFLITHLLFPPSETSLDFVFGNWRFPSDTLRLPWHPNVIRLIFSLSSNSPLHSPFLSQSAGVWDIQFKDPVSPLYRLCHIVVHTTDLPASVWANAFPKIISNM